MASVMRFFDWECKLVNEKDQGWCLKLFFYFKDFFGKIYQPKMKNPWKTRHRFFRVDRVYIHQNDRLEKRKIVMRAVFKNMQPSPRYLRFCDFVLHNVLLISLAMKHFFQNRSHHEFSFFEPVILMYINPFNSKKCGTTFS